MAEPLHVVQVVDDLDVGGVRAVVLDLLRGFDPTQVRCSLIALSDPPGDLDRLDIPGRASAFFEPAAPLEDFSARAYLADALLLGRARGRFADALARIEALRPDVLHLHTSPRTLPLGLTVERRHGLPLVFTDHLLRLRPSDHHLAARLVLRTAYRRMYRPYHLVSVGQSVADANEAWGLRGTGKRHLVLENRIDLHRFRPPHGPRKEEPLDFIYVARLHPVKGQDTLIRAFLRMEAPSSCRLLLVGPDAMDGALQNVAATEARSGREVVFLGVRHDVPELLRDASVGVFPSRREGKPLALMEMMASSLPVVVSDIPELAAMIEDGSDGLVVPVDDVEALAQALGRLAGDRKLREHLGWGARATVERVVGPDPVPVMEHLYLELADRG